MSLFIEYPSWINPQVVSFLPIRWYAVMYLVAFLITYILFRYQTERENRLNITSAESQDLFIWTIVGLLLCAHLFSKLFYDDGWYYITHPWLIFWPFQNGKFVGLPGMSYHGGIIGAVIGGGLYCKKYKRNLMEVTDIIVAGIPLGFTFGRLGNFINGELYGRVTTASYGMIFPDARLFSTHEAWVRDVADQVGIAYTRGDLINLPRHASQLYEAFFEGIVLFLLIWFIFKPLKDKKKLAHGTLLAIYLFFYGCFRFIIEYFRQPDSHIGYIFEWGEKSDNIAIFQSALNISQGQILCFLMMIAAVILYIVLNRRRQNVKYKSKSR